MRIALGIEMFIHILQHVLDAYLLAVTHTPNGIEGEALGDTRLKDKHSCSARSADKIGSFWIERGNGFGEYAVVMTVEQTYAVGAYQRTLVLLASVKYFLLHFCTFLGLFAKAGRDDDKGAYLLFARQIVHIVGTETGGHHQYGHIGRGDVADVVECLHALHLVFLRVDDAQAGVSLGRKSACRRKGKSAFDKITN